MDTLTTLSTLLDKSQNVQWESPIQSLSWLNTAISTLGLKGNAFIIKMPDHCEYWHYEVSTQSLKACDGIFINKLEMGLLDQEFDFLEADGYLVYYPKFENPQKHAVAILIKYALAKFAKAQANKLLVNAKRTFELTFEQVSSGRCVTDLEGWIQEVNQKFCDIIGYSYEETLNLRIKDLTYPEDWHIDWEHKQKLFAHQIPHFSMQKRYIKKDGSLTWVYTTVTLIKGLNDQPDYLIGIVQDINDQKAAEALLLDQNERLEALVQARTTELTEANAIKDQTIKQLENLQALLVKNATIDPLTGLYNRRYMLEKITHEFGRFQRDQRPFSLILTDIDYFKSINDLRGHDCGDEVLVQVSEMLLTRLRTIDIVCRWGGEEFLILLPNTEAPQAREIAERIREYVAKQGFSYDQSTFHITMTFGIATAVPGISPKALIKIADTALYKGKSLGRNCVV